MQKSKLATILIIIGILLFGLFSNIELIYKFNRIYLYLINPVFWILLSVLLFFTFGNNYDNKKLRKNIIQYTTVAVLSYIIIYLLSGLFVTFGNNPYNTTIKGLINNLWITGVAICLKEYVRYKLINNVYEKDKIKFAIIISIVYVIIDIEFRRIFGGTVATLTIIKYISQVIIPNIAENILFSYTSIHSNYIPAVIYKVITKLYYWISPILPNSPWAMTAIIDTVIPVILFLYIRYEKNKLNPERDRQTLINTNPGNIIPLIIAIVLAIWFALGIFPIKPVAIATGSMEKEIYTGDVVIIKKCNPNDVNVGDIIEYQMEGFTVIHRIIEKKQKNGEFYFRTKGDNNNAPDQNEVREKQLIGKVIFKIRYIGYPAVWLHLLQVEEQTIGVETGN